MVIDGKWMDGKMDGWKNERKDNILFYVAIGSTVEVHSRSQGLKSSVWLSEEYPLSLQDQILPIVELMVRKIIDNNNNNNNNNKIIDD